VAPTFPASEAMLATSVFDNVTDLRQQENHTKVKAPPSNQIFIGQILSNKIHSLQNSSSESASGKNSSFQDSVKKITSNLEKYNSEVLSRQFNSDENFTCLEDYTRQIGENVPDGRSVFSGQGHSGYITVHRPKSGIIAPNEQVLFVVISLYVLKFVLFRYSSKF
jgi:hypothetical protein